MFDWRRHAREMAPPGPPIYSTVILSGAHPPWKPCGTRTGRRIVATGSPVKSCACTSSTRLSTPAVPLQMAQAWPAPSLR